MRFGLTLLFSLGVGSLALAAPWDSVTLTPAAETFSPRSPLSMQRGGSSDTLSTIKGLNLTQFAKSLGKVSAIALAANGTLYAADKATGRIWVLSDRGYDGTLDIRRPLPKLFDAPSGLAVIEDTLYIADRQAIWAIEAGSDPKVLAPLTNVQSQGHHPLSIDQTADKSDLIIGITQAESALLARIDTQSGHAEKIADIPSATAIKALALRQGAPLWVSTGASIFSIESPETALNFGDSSISALALPGQYETAKHWPSELSGTIIASQTGADTMRLIVVPTEFGQPAGEPRVLVDGFLSRSGRTAWGEPGAIVMDKRGLFFADKHNGTIWRLYGAPKDTPKPEAKIIVVEDLPETVATPPIRPPLLIGSGIKGSQLGEASLLESASNLKTGSTIVEDYDKAKAEANALAEKENRKPKNRKRR